ncbi:MAG: hypothetical protein AAF074_05045 [Pseudomonadota bacterium]
MRRRRPGERGFVLVAVLWLGVALAIAASGFLGTARRESYRVRAEIESAHAVEIARTALNLAMADLGRPDGARRSPRDGTPVIVPVPGGEARFRIRDEKGKVDLNRAPVTLLAGTLQRLGAGGLDAVDYASLADRLLALAREARESGAAPSLPELLARAGLSQSVASRAALVLTLHNYGPRINPETAPPEVLAAVPSMGAEDLEAILEARRLGEPLPVLGAAQGWFENNEGPVYSIHTTGRTANGVSATIMAMVLSDGRGFRSGRRRFRILEARVLR